MTPAKFLFFSFIQWVILILVKIVYFKQVIFGSLFNVLFLWIVMCVVAVALIRRFGVINYLESLFLVFVWVIGDLFGDLIVTSGIVGLSMFEDVNFWLGNLLMALSILLFHKKWHLYAKKGHGH